MYLSIIPIIYMENATAVDTAGTLHSDIVVSGNIATQNLKRLGV
jgi:hypothetical protein